MDVTLQKHEAKHIYKVPEGLRELCTDISREVLRSQPTNLYAFIAEYVDTLLITRENTKIAIKVVNNILLESQAILSILYRAGFTLEQIAVAAPRIQKAFRDYLDAVDIQPVPICGDTDALDEKSMISVRSILEATGATQEDAERAATVIQAAFRGHYERLLTSESQGKVQWQKALTNTLDILRKAGATQTEITSAAKHIKFAYQGYYTRRNRKIDVRGLEEDYEKDERILEPAEAIQAVAWMEMMYKDSGLSMEKANEAATVIQRAYRNYHSKSIQYDVQRLESTKSMIVEAIVDNLRQRVFDTVASRKDIPEEYGTREELVASSMKLQLAFKEHLRVTRMAHEGYLEAGEHIHEEYLGEESEEGEETVRAPSTEPSPTSECHHQESEAKSEIEYTEEQLTEAETDEQRASDAEITTEQLPTSPEVQSEPETEYPAELEAEEDVEKQGAKEDEEQEEEEEPEKEEEEVKEEEVKEEEAKEEEAKEEEAKEEEAKEENEGDEELVASEPNVAPETGSSDDNSEMI